MEEQEDRTVFFCERVEHFSIVLLCGVSLKCAASPQLAQQLTALQQGLTCLLEDMFRIMCGEVAEEGLAEHLLGTGYSKNSS